VEAGLSEDDINSQRRSTCIFSSTQSSISYIPRCPLSTPCLAMIHISALHGNLILAAIGRIAVQHPNELAIGSMSYGQLASNVLSSASNLLSASLSDGMLGSYDLEEETVTMPGLALYAKVVGLLATWAAGGVGTSSEHPGRTDGPDLPLVFYDPSTSSGGEAHQPYRLAELELHDVRPRREGDETVYVDNSQVASWLAELELTDLERKAYIVDDSTQGVSVLFCFSCRASCNDKPKPANLTDVERTFGSNTGRHPRGPGPRQSQAHRPDSSTSRLADLWHHQQGPVSRTIKATAQGPGTVSAGSSITATAWFNRMRIWCDAT
jgi:hypothetical protein